MCSGEPSRRRPSGTWSLYRTYDAGDMNCPYVAPALWAVLASEAAYLAMARFLTLASPCDVIIFSASDRLSPSCIASPATRLRQHLCPLTWSCIHLAGPSVYGLSFRAREQAMHKTVGKTDRTLRAVLAIGAVLGSGAVGFSSASGIVLLAVAAIMVVTGATRYCPVYGLIGINTRGTDTLECGDSGLGHLHHRAA